MWGCLCWVINGACGLDGRWGLMVVVVCGRLRVSWDGGEIGRYGGYCGWAIWCVGSGAQQYAV